MPTCCIKQCKARKNSKRPLTIHRFPVKESLRRKWIESIGLDNIKTKNKSWHVCSDHFPATSFNRTLDVIRLRENAVPLPPLQADQIDPESNLDPQFTSRAIIMIVGEPNKLGFHEQNLSTSPVKLGLPHNNSTNYAHSILNKQPENKVTNLARRYQFLKRKVRSLNEKVRRRDQKIALFCDIIRDLKKRKYISADDTFWKSVDDLKV